MSLNTTPRTWVAGELVTAAELNTEIRDAFAGLQAAWTAFTPSWTGSSSNPAIVNGTIAGGYMQVGKTVHFWIEITMGTSTTYGTGNWQLTLPVPEAAHRWLFTGNARDTSAVATFPLFAERTGSNLLTLRALPTTAGNAYVPATSAVPFTWASADVLTISGTYEAA
ncbi:hypothetical protein [Nocardioides jejuensis]|uniref:Uncharacterized protein n=1 Tax=Nocardioides jejuensis TaxID=2502782 RepID=A0A4R1BZY2_9ACTN|nr:hypothetical protein [Nocardioides jejuensis]TCJ23016.1 hypothetical protein EPD65_11685 [Nocardioides jejuensis]